MIEQTTKTGRRPKNRLATLLDGLDAEESMIERIWLAEQPSLGVSQVSAPRAHTLIKRMVRLGAVRCISCRKKVKSLDGAFNMECHDPERGPFVAIACSEMCKERCVRNGI